MKKDEVLKKFDDYGKKASYHFACESDNWEFEYKLGNIKKNMAMSLWDEYPELHVEMRKLAKHFLWLIDDVLNARNKNGE
jgi:hypothetical protein